MEFRRRQGKSSLVLRRFREERIPRGVDRRTQFKPQEQEGSLDGSKDQRWYHELNLISVHSLSDQTDKLDTEEVYRFPSTSNGLTQIKGIPSLANSSTLTQMKTTWNAGTKDIWPAVLIIKCRYHCGGWSTGSLGSSQTLKQPRDLVRRQACP